MRKQSLLLPPLSPFISWVFGEDFLTEELDVEVCIDLCGDDALMAQHLLDGTETGASLQEMSRERVTKGVWRDGFGDACRLSELFDHGEDHDTSQLSTATVEKEEVFVMWFDGHLVATLQPKTYLLDRDGRQRHKTLFASLAVDTHVSEVEIDIGNLKIDKFRDTQSRTIERLNDGEIAMSKRLREVDALLYPLNLLHGKHRWEVFRYGGLLKQLGGVVGAFSRHHKETEEGMETGNDTCLRTGLNANLVEKDQIILQVCQSAGGRLLLSLHQKLKKLREVGRVGFNGIGSQRPLKEQIVTIFFQQVCQGD